MPVNQCHPSAAYKAILGLIMAGEIAPASAISTRSLAERTGIGRTPVREALQALARDGVVEIVPTRGTFVRRPSMDEVREIYEVRVALEGTAALLVAQRGPSQRLRRIGADLAALRAVADPDFDVARVLGWEFHDELIHSTENALLGELYAQVSRKFSLTLRQGRRYDDHRVMETLSEHLEIFAALEAHDAPRAQNLMQAHIQRAFMVRVKVLYDPQYQKRSEKTVGGSGSWD